MVIHDRCILVSPFIHGHVFLLQRNPGPVRKLVLYRHDCATVLHEISCVTMHSFRSLFGALRLNVLKHEAI